LCASPRARAFRWSFHRHPLPINHCSRVQKLYEMSVYERVEFAQELKKKTAADFTAELQALNTYASAVDAVRYVQHKSV
jgi:hypothetical protein